LPVELPDEVVSDTPDQAVADNAWALVRLDDSLPKIAKVFYMEESNHFLTHVDSGMVST